MGSVRTFSKHIFWTDSEIEYVRILYPLGKYSEILSALPGRTKSQIQNKANSIGVIRIKDPKMTDDEIRESKRKHMENRRREDPEKVRLYQIKRYHANRDKNLKVMKRYQKRRFFWIRATKLRGEGKATTADIASLWKKQRGICALTGRKMDRSAQLDHITAKARGGDDKKTNLRWLCKEVNLARRELSDAEFITLCEDCMAWIGSRIKMVEELTQ